MTEEQMVEYAQANSIPDSRRILVRLYTEGAITAEQFIATLLDEHITLYGTGEPPKFAGVIKATEEARA